MFGSEFAGAEQRINDWEALIEERARRAGDVSDQLRGLTAQGEAERRAVKVTLDRNGNMTDLTLDQEVTGWTVERIARAVLDANAAARVNLSGQVRRTLNDAGFYGDDQ